MTFNYRISIIILFVAPALCFAQQAQKEAEGQVSNLRAIQTQELDEAEMQHEAQSPPHYIVNPDISLEELLNYHTFFINELIERVNTLEAQIATHEARIAELQAKISTLEAEEEGG